MKLSFCTLCKGRRCQLEQTLAANLATIRAMDPEKLGGLVRRHWGIESPCHRALDMTFDVDGCRARKGNAAENLALLRKLMLILLRHDQTTKGTMRGKRIRAAPCETTLETLLKLDVPE